MIGPDWGFSLVKIGLLNSLMGWAVISLSWQDFDMKLKQFGILLMLIENVCFAATALGNPGLVRRSPEVHSKIYLNKQRNLK